MLWLVCQIHLQQNAQANVTRQNLQAEVASPLRANFTALDHPIVDQHPVKR
jgi:hypothetical protein